MLPWNIMHFFRIARSRRPKKASKQSKRQYPNRHKCYTLLHHDCWSHTSWNIDVLNLYTVIIAQLRSNSWETMSTGVLWEDHKNLTANLKLIDINKKRNYTIYRPLTLQHPLPPLDPSTPPFRPLALQRPPGPCQRPPGGGTAHVGKHWSKLQ